MRAEPRVDAKIQWEATATLTMLWDQPWCSKSVCTIVVSGRQCAQRVVKVHLGQPVPCAHGLVRAPQSSHARSRIYSVGCVGRRTRKHTQAWGRSFLILQRYTGPLWPPTSPPYFLTLVKKEEMEEPPSANITAETRIQTAACRLENILSNLLPYLRVMLEPACTGEACTRLKHENARLQDDNARLIQLLRTHPSGPPPKPPMLPQRRLRIAARAGWKCAACGELLSESFHIDHIRPWADTFDNTDANLQPLCCADHALKTSNENSSRNRRGVTEPHSDHEL